MHAHCSVRHLPVTDKMEGDLLVLFFNIGFSIGPPLGNVSAGALVCAL